MTPSPAGVSLYAGGRSRAMRDLSVSSILFFCIPIHPSIADSLARVHQTGAFCAWNFDFAGTRPHASAPTSLSAVAQQQERKRPIDACALSSLHIIYTCAWHQVRTQHTKEGRDVHYISHRGQCDESRTHAAHELTTLICLFLFHARFCAERALYLSS